jgi:hypothetical protein
VAPVLGCGSSSTNSNNTVTVVSRAETNTATLVKLATGVVLFIKQSCTSAAM